VPVVHRVSGPERKCPSDILEHLVDKLMPRDFERMAAEGFRELKG